MRFPKPKFEIGDMVINALYKDLFFDRISDICWDWASKTYEYNGFDEENLSQSHHELMSDHLKNDGDPNFKWGDIHGAYKQWFKK